MKWMSSLKPIFEFNIFWRLNSKFLWVHWKIVKISAKRAHPRVGENRLFSFIPVHLPSLICQCEWEPSFVSVMLSLQVQICLKSGIPLKHEIYNHFCTNIRRIGEQIWRFHFTWIKHPVGALLFIHVCDSFCSQGMAPSLGRGRGRGAVFRELPSSGGCPP